MYICSCRYWSTCRLWRVRNHAIFSCSLGDESVVTKFKSLTFSVANCEVLFIDSRGYMNYTTMYIVGQIQTFWKGEARIHNIRRRNQKRDLCPKDINFLLWFSCFPELAMKGKGRSRLYSGGVGAVVGISASQS